VTGKPVTNLAVVALDTEGAQTEFVPLFELNRKDGVLVINAGDQQKSAIFTVLQLYKIGEG
jgi:hypothetical protein